GFLLITNLKIIFLRSKGKDHFIQDLKFDLDSGVIVGKTSVQVKINNEKFTPKESSVNEIVEFLNYFLERNVPKKRIQNGNKTHKISEVELVTLKCPSCGAPLKTNRTENKKIKCEYCNSEVLLTKI
ncbi:MAG: hypothetical protein ACTSVE_00850, partial [Candidatus Helarchaeota archaeon]